MTADTKPIPETITLERTGQPPLKFNGTLLTTACGQFVQPPKDKPNADYFTVSLYQVNTGKADHDTFVVEIVYTKTFRDTQKHYTAILTDHPAGELINYEPLGVLIGFPPREEFAERQNALEAKMRRQYDVLVSAVLKDFPEEIGDTADDDDDEDEDFNTLLDALRFIERDAELTVKDAREIATEAIRKVTQ